MRFSLRWLFGAVTFVAVGCACLIFASLVVRTSIEFALSLFLLLSVLGSFYAPRERRAFWGGCAVVGWYYMACAYLPFDFGPRNVAGWALSGIFQKMYVRDASGLYAPDVPDTSDFFGVGNALAAFLAALAGGAVAIWFNRRASRKSAGQTIP